ncbi:MAG: fumarylacetoacetase [Candidatus Phosphoribacter sp.]|nr:fumarylacetoacetase [Actinomycetales bacterium]
MSPNTVATAAPWLGVPADHPFGIATLPYGVFTTTDLPDRRRIGVRIGDRVLDLRAAVEAAGAPAADLHPLVAGPTLAAMLAAAPSDWARLRAWITTQLGDDKARGLVEPFLLGCSEVTLLLPVEIGDYVDYYASAHHGSNVGKIFRPESPALPVNWKHLPIGYHGRSGTVVVTGTDFHRPSGQRKGPQDPAPVFGPSIRLDIEAELGYLVGGATRLGQRLSVDDAGSRLFGVVILNDWSARDIQAWEYVPLGPYLGKSFCTSISGWVTPLAALDAAHIELPRDGDDPEVLPYLRGTGTSPTGSGGTAYGLDVHVEVRVNGTVVARPEYRDMYWSPAQMLAHMTVNGASVRPGDLFGSGTISGPEKGQRGSLLELSWGGSEPFALDDGSSRTYLLDGDEVVMTAWAPGPGGSRVGLGEVAGRVLPTA